MKCKILHTIGNGKFEETEYTVPPMKDNEIRVKTLMTGVCRSDIDMANGKFGPLPLHMQGHEGLGQVIDVGKNVVHVKTGETVATRGEPAYADYYNVRDGEFVVVPEAHQRYILEPIACGINVVEQASDQLRKREGKGKRLLIMGSGFLAWVAYTKLRQAKYKFKIDVVGSNNRGLWKSRLKRQYNGTYDVVMCRAVAPLKRLIPMVTKISHPETVFFSHDTKIGKDVEIEANVVFGENVTIKDNVVIKSFCSIENSIINNGSSIGPFARLRNNVNVGKDSRIGNFVELKNSSLENDVKISHLSYIGDAEIQDSANIGAGTITCNYDGVNKHKTTIGKRSFIGSNTSLIAPINIGNDASIAAGSSISKDVDSNSLAITRAPIRFITNWSKKFKKR